MDDADGGWAPERREMLGLFAGLALLQPAAAFAADAAPDRAAFDAVSSAVTGMSQAELTSLGDALFERFKDQGAALTQLAVLVQATPPGQLSERLKGTPLDTLARALAAAWYTGMVGRPGSVELLSYNNALAWRAMGYRAAPAQCAGAFGFWANPPAGA